MFKHDIQTITAFAPATTSNLQVGFDVLGFPVSFIGDRVTLSLREDNKLNIVSIEADAPIPSKVTENTATIALRCMLDKLGVKQGLDVSIAKGIPLSSGLGGSAASAVAAVVALNGLLAQPFDKRALAQFALEGESFVSGGAHLDNIVPCLWGELTLIREVKTVDVVTLPMPDLFIVLIHPNCQIETKAARAALAKTVPLSSHIIQSANLGAFVAGCYLQDNHLIQRAMKDVIIEPQRAHLLEGFQSLQDGALSSGAIACSFSGAGPTLFALTQSEAEAKSVGETLQKGFMKQSIESQYWYEHIASCPATLLGTT